MNVAIALTGTDPNEPLGGIGVAMQGFRDALQRQGIAHEVIPSYQAGSFGGGTWYTIASIFRLVNWVKRQRRDCVVPVVYAHGGGPIGVFRQWVILYICKWLGARTLLQVHSAAALDYLEHDVSREVLRMLFRRVDRVCVVSRWWKGVFEQYGVAEPLVIPNCLSFDALRRGEEVRRRSRDSQKASVPPGEELVLTFMARLVKDKGLEETIEAIIHVSGPVKLIVAGEGPVKVDCERLAEELGVGSEVEFVGWVTGQEKSAVLARTDVFCLPSINESFGMGYLEAMACGIPVLAVDWGPIPDVVAGGRTGILVTRQDAISISRGIEELRDAGERDRMSRLAIEWVEENYSPSAVGERIQAAAEQVATRVTRAG